MWLRILTLILGLAIPSLIYFDMIDLILLVTIGIYYSIILLTNGLGALLLAAHCTSNDEDFKDILHDRLKTEMLEDRHYNYRIISLLILEFFTVLMVYPLSLIVASILVVMMLFRVTNILLIKKVLNST